MHYVTKLFVILFNSRRFSLSLFFSLISARFKTFVLASLINFLFVFSECFFRLLNMFFFLILLIIFFFLVFLAINSVEYTGASLGVVFERREVTDCFAHVVLLVSRLVAGKRVRDGVQFTAPCLM